MPLPLASLWSRIASLPALYLLLWAALAASTVVLLVLMRTAWGRRRPTHRYVLLSVVVHLGLICLATTVRFMSAPVGEQAAAPMTVRITMRAPRQAVPAADESAPRLPAEPVEQPDNEPTPQPPPLLDPPPAQPSPASLPPTEPPAGR
ncbi:MAG: hypothetical protein AAF790_06845, partial [Planctomycetota bacterium]